MARVLKSGFVGVLTGLGLGVVCHWGEDAYLRFKIHAAMRELVTSGGVVDAIWMPSYVPIAILVGFIGGFFWTFQRDTKTRAHP